MRIQLLRDVELEIDGALRSLKAGKVLDMRGIYAMVLIGNGSAKFFEGEAPPAEPEAVEAAPPPEPEPETKPAPKRKRSKKA